jgi:hypothetical protein
MAARRNTNKGPAPTAAAPYSPGSIALPPDFPEHLAALVSAANGASTLPAIAAAAESLTVERQATAARTFVSTATDYSANGRLVVVEYLTATVAPPAMPEWADVRKHLESTHGAEWHGQAVSNLYESYSAFRFDALSHLTRYSVLCDQADAPESEDRSAFLSDPATFNRTARGLNRYARAIKDGRVSEDGVIRASKDGTDTKKAADDKKAADKKKASEDAAAAAAAVLDARRDRLELVEMKALAAAAPIVKATMTSVDMAAYILGLDDASLTECGILWTAETARRAATAAAAAAVTPEITPESGAAEIIAAAAEVPAEVPAA